MYRGETCDECGMAVAFFTRSYWNAPHDLWNEVMGTDAGTLCPPCFTLAARAKDIPVHWRAQRTLVYLDREDVPLGEPPTVDMRQPDWWRPTGKCPETCG